MHALGAMTGFTNAMATSLPAVGAGVLAAYVAVTALLVTLAITRHDSLVPISRAIAGRRHLWYLVEEIVAFVLAVAAGQVSWAPIRVAAIPFEACGLGIAVVVLWRAINAAMNPRAYDLLATRLVAKDIAARVSSAFSAHRAAPLPSGCRADLPVENFTRQNPDLTVLRSGMKGMIVYRPRLVTKLATLNRAQPSQRDWAWLVQRSGRFVDKDAPLAIVPPRTRRAWTARRAVRVMRFDGDYWRDVALLTITADSVNDHAAFSQGMDILVAGVRALGSVLPGGVSYAEMWPPPIGSPEGFEIGKAYTDVVRHLMVERFSTIAGQATLKLVILSMEQPTTCQATCRILDNLERANISFSDEDLGRAMLRQRYFDMSSGMDAIWSRVRHYWLSAPNAFDHVAQWLNEAKIQVSHLEGDDNLVGAMLVPVKDRSAYISSLVNEQAYRTFERLKAAAPSPDESSRGPAGQ